MTLFYVFFVFYSIDLNISEGQQNKLISGYFLEENVVYTKLILMHIRRKTAID